MFKQSPQTLYGIQIFISDNAVRQRPKRVHARNRTGKKSYHQRIQKKWNKRYGYLYEPCIYKTENGYFVHPAIYPALIKHCEH